ncbi:MAG: phosphatase PAP2/dual specificity phosphatase family protein [Fibrobacteria bacterium]|nr:phosphatase PAP2/dual specificity phosphatase family protein [Fibrobacteria bacterium]
MSFWREGFPRRGEATRPWGWAFVVIVFLAPFFFLTYGYATGVTAALPEVPSVVFDWERSIPFWPWTIVPYWSIDLLYGFSLLLCATRRQLASLVASLLTVQILSVACFLLFPLRFTFERPPTDGVFGRLFDILMGFDKPFNQAPSLHIGLLVILWIVYARGTRGLVRGFFHIWFLLIGISVLTTYQHHFLDVPTGALAGAFSAWLWPWDGRAPWRDLHLPRPDRSSAIGAAYLLGASACALLASSGGGWLWFLWGTVSLGLVSFHYFFGGAHGFQKTAPWPTAASLLLHAPVHLGAWINSRLWTFSSPRDSELQDGIWLGRIPSAGHAHQAGYHGVLDLTGELPGPRHPGWVGHPLLDLVTPSRAQLEEAADRLERMRTDGKVLVCCALGYSRSASVACAWLLRTGRAADVSQAVERIRKARPRVRLSPSLLSRLAEIGRLPGSP